VDADYMQGFLAAPRARPASADSERNRRYIAAFQYFGPRSPEALFARFW